MTSPVDIRPDHLAIVQGILREHLPVDVKVCVFGSRASWTTKDSSDLDLALEGDGKLSHKVLGALNDAFDDSVLPYTVDVVDLHRIGDSFRQIVESQRVPLPLHLEEANHRSAGKPEKDWLYRPQFPEHWSRRSLYSMAQWVNGLAFRNFQFSGTGMPVVKIAEIKNGISGQTKYTEQIFDESVRVNEGDLLFSWSGQPDTSIDAFWWRGPEGWLNQHIFRVTPEHDVDEAFFYCLLRYLRPNFVAIARNKQTTGLGHVTKQDLEEIEAALPPLSEQRTIAHILGTLDDKIELNRRMNETLEAMARALFKSWFVDFEPVRAKMEGRWRRGESLPGLPADLYNIFPDRLVDSELGEVPEGWEVKALGEVVDLNPPEPMKRGTLAPYLDMAALPTSGSSPDTAVLREFKSGTRFRNGDTLLARITPCLENGKTAFVQSLQDGEVGWGSTEFIVMRAMPPVPPEYPYLLGRDVDFREHAIQSMTGTSGRQRVQVDALAPYPLSRPSAETWNEFSALASPLFAQVEFNRKESLALVAQRDTLLPRLVSGEVGVENHNVTPQDAAR